MSAPIALNDQLGNVIGVDLRDDLGPKAGHEVRPPVDGDCAEDRENDCGYERHHPAQRAGGEPLRLAREDVAPPEFEGFDVNET